MEREGRPPPPLMLGGGEGGNKRSLLHSRPLGRALRLGGGGGGRECADRRGG